MNTSIFANLCLNTVIKNSSRIRSVCAIQCILVPMYDKMANAYYNMHIIMN